MHNFLFSSFIFLLTSSIVIAIDYFNVPRYTVQQAIIIFIALSLLIINLIYFRLIKFSVLYWAKWFVLFCATTFVYLVVITTGGLYSPFLILLHLSTLGISLLLHFSIAVIFLCFSFLIIVSNILLNEAIADLLIGDPGVFLLLGASFLTIVPLAKLLSDTYHVKDIVLRTLTNQIKVEESLLAEINELIFITDKEMRILSVNDAVERTLRRSRLELVNQNLFDVLFLKDKNGNFITKETIGIEQILQTKTAKVISDLSLLATAETMRKVALHIKPIADLEGTIGQLSIVINDSNHLQNSTVGEHKNIEEARIKHEAIIEDLKRKLLDQGLFDFATRLIFISKSERDILMVRTIEDHGIVQNKILIDVANICQQIVQKEQEYAQALGVSLAFTLLNFKEKEIQSPLLKTFHFAIKQPTGPFFTSLCDVKYFELLIQKLLELATLLASSEDNPQVRLTIEQTSSLITIKIVATSSIISQEEQEHLFVQYYGPLREKTNLQRGSGLEGFLAKIITDTLNIPIEVVINPPYCTFAIKLQKYTSLPLSGHVDK